MSLRGPPWGPTCPATVLCGGSSPLGWSWVTSRLLTFSARLYPVSLISHRDGNNQPDVHGKKRNSLKQKSNARKLTSLKNVLKKKVRNSVTCESCLYLCFFLSKLYISQPSHRRRSQTRMHSHGYLLFVPSILRGSPFFFFSILLNLLQRVSLSLPATVRTFSTDAPLNTQQRHGR